MFVFIFLPGALHLSRVTGVNSATNHLDTRLPPETFPETLSGTVFDDLAAVYNVHVVCNFNCRSDLLIDEEDSDAL